MQKKKSISHAPTGRRRQGDRRYNVADYCVCGSAAMHGIIGFILATLWFYWAYSTHRHAVNRTGSNKQDNLIKNSES